MHVDVMLVGEQELDDAQQVLGTGRLLEGDASGCRSVPVDGVGIDRAAVDVDASAGGAQAGLDRVSPPKSPNKPPQLVRRIGDISFSLMPSGTPQVGWKTM